MRHGRRQAGGAAEAEPVLLIRADDIRRVLRIDRDGRLELAVHPVDLAREHECRHVARSERARCTVAVHGPAAAGASGRRIINAEAATAARMPFLMPDPSLG